MCEPKNKGGRRCLSHAAASKFITRLTELETGAGVDFIKQTLSELNKEGKKLPAPQIAEVRNWLDQQKFVTEYNPTLTPHDRKIQLNQINRSYDEIDKGVTGGNFHAWKNVMDTVKGKVARRVATASVVAGMTLSLAGCFAGGVNSPTTTPSDPSSETPTPTASSQAYGVAEGTGQKTTDKLGEYEHVTVPEDSPAYTYDPSVKDPSVEKFGFTDEDAASAQKFAVKVAVEQMFDSSALDTGVEGYNEWHANEAPKYFNQEMIAGSDANSATDIVLNNRNPQSVPEMIRDGKPRVSNVTVSVNKIYADSYQGNNFIAVGLDYSVDYRVSDSSIIALSSTNSGMNETQLKDVLKDEVFDGQGENKFNSYGNSTVGLNKVDGNNWIINGVGNNFYYNGSAYTK
jgi:hypothetical protein